MAKLRNITEDTLHVPLLGREVEPDTVVDVPDDVYAAHDWPETVWAVVSAPKPPKTAPTTEES